MACELLLSSVEQLDLLWHYDCVVSPRVKQRGSRCSFPGTWPAGGAAEDGGGPASPTWSSSSWGSEGMKGDERRVVERVFEALDENRDGKLTAEELRRGFERLGIAPRVEKDEEEEEELQLHVRLDEFLRLCQSACSTSLSPTSGSPRGDLLNAVSDDDDEEEEEEEVLEAAFRLFDADRNGLIGPAELQRVLCALGLPEACELQECVHMIERVDRNGDGHIDFSEFKSMLRLCAAPCSY